MIDMAKARDLVEYGNRSPIELELAIKASINDFKKGTRKLWTRQEGYTEIQSLDIKGGIKYNKLWFKLFPIETISLIEWNYDETESDAETVDSDYYNVLAEEGSVERNSGFYYPFVKATITGGYTNDQIWDEFPDIVEAIILETKYKLIRDSDKNIAINSEGFEKGQTNLRSSVHHKRFDAVVKRYRRI